MTRNHIRFATITALLALGELAHASTYGDNLLGVGASARSLGGAGQVAPQDVLGAITANPATLDQLAGTTGEFDFSATFFVPHVSARVGSVTADSASKTYLIPALAYAAPRSRHDDPWAFGLSAYGVSGLGVDYRKSALDTNLGPTPYPLVAGIKTELQILEIAPAFSYRLSPEWSLGLAGRLDYGRLNLGGGAKGGFGAGLQPGVTYRPNEHVTLGVSYVSGAAVTYKGVTDFDGNGTADSLQLEAPPEIRLGAGYELLPGSLTVSTEYRWVNWGGAKGYKDFDWEDSHVWGFGVQYRAIPGRLTLRAGYSFSTNPLRLHQGWNGTGSPANVTNVQGKWINNYYYETFRVVGFPAIVERHASIGVSIALAADNTLDIGYTHAFRNRITESGTNLLGAPVTLSSALSEDSLEVGWVRRF